MAKRFKVSFEIVLDKKNSTDAMTTLMDVFPDWKNLSVEEVLDGN